MKVVKGFAILSFFSILLGSCFDTPEFPVAPSIEYECIGFFEGATTDSLVLSINFKDGDGNLGLDAQNPLHFSDPFNDVTYYQTNASGELIPLKTTPAELTRKNGRKESYDFFEIENPALGQLVFSRTQKENPLYSNLPDYNCADYAVTSFLIASDDLSTIDAKSRIDTTITSGSTTYYLITDTLYLKSNPNHYNIEVDFLLKDPGNKDADENGFIEYDWRKERCTTFDGRFPLLSDKTSTLEGTLRYGMYSSGFDILFSIRVLKLRVQIKDRDLNVSNVLYTPEFTLQSIRGACND
jgi:hypothetical protein